MIFLASIFRDSVGYVNRWASQVRALRGYLDSQVHVIAVEGDSSDGTYKMLANECEIDTLLRVEHGGPMFASTIHPLRWRQLALPGNAALCAAVRLAEDGDQFVYVESDLMWEPDDIAKLLARDACVAPMSMVGGRFYDSWGHTKDGRCFLPHPPYCAGWEPGATDLIPIDTAGSCFVLTSDALKVAEFSKEECIRGIGRSIFDHGHRLYLDPTARVVHP